MLESRQFQSTYAVRNVLSDLKVLMTINQRHGTTETDEWTCSMGNAPTELDGWKQYTELLQTKPRQVVVSIKEKQRRGPQSGEYDVSIPFIDSGLQISEELLTRLRCAISFFARHRADPGRGSAHDQWAAGMHRMAGLRANPIFEGFGSYSPTDSSLLHDSVWLAEEAAAEKAVGEFLQIADRELLRVCPTHHSASNAPRMNTHNFAGPRAAASRHPVFEAAQTTAACAIGWPAFGAHSDPNAGFLSPFVAIFPEHMVQSTTREQAVMQFVRALAYVPISHGTCFWFNPDNLHAFRASTSLLTDQFSDYQIHAERQQNTAWKEARKLVLATARERILSFEPKLADDREELDLRTFLECGPLTLAGLVQEKCLSRMTTQMADLSDAAVLPNRHAPQRIATAKTTKSHNHDKDVPDTRLLHRTRAATNTATRKRNSNPKYLP
jgi:hypothetical protein